MKKHILAIAALALSTVLSAQTDVTSKYIQNPDFGARFAGWFNPGSFNYSVGTNFSQKSGEVFMEKWVASGGTLGTNSGIKQRLYHLPEGTYTLVCGAQNLNQQTKKADTGAFLYAGDNQIEISDSTQYSLVFTVPENTTLDIGVKLTSCKGNWVAVDNFRLYKKTANADSLATAKAKADAELKTLTDGLANPTGNVPKVTTNTYVAMGTTIALGRGTFTSNGATIKEKGFCWSTQPNPTILDEKTSEKFTDTGDLYRMEGLEPATIYYVRAYALTSGYQVGYGNVVKIATMPKGTVTSWYDYAASDDAVNWRINSAMQECIWMYNNLANIRGFGLSVHYVYGCGAGGGTADCSYGGYMRVSQNTPYQQTGTLLHETNHGVGVGTTSEWYNNSNLRSNTSSGLWLGPRATKMVQFLENNAGAYMQGDGTHMWAGTTSGTLKYGYGINGANEDSYQPSNQLLYFGNILITHALHQDGLICSSSVGFATPAYVFTQDDDTKYYITCESTDCGGGTSYLGLTGSGIVKSFKMSAAEAKADDNYAWHITYDPKTSYYIFYNIGQKKYLTNNNSSIKSASKSTVSSAEKFHLMPAREMSTFGNLSTNSFWLLTGSGHYALEGGSTFTESTNSYNTKTSSFNATNNATAQRWFFLTSDEMENVEKSATDVAAAQLTELIKNVRNVKSVSHSARQDAAQTEEIDNALESVLTEAESANDWASLDAVNKHITDVQTALQDFLAATTPISEDNPYDLTFLLNNPDFDTDLSGWTQTSGSAAWGNQCAEFYEETYDFNQTTQLKLPAARYEVKVQAFERPGAYADVYKEFVTNKTNNAKAYVYAKSKQQVIHNICDTCSTTNITGSVAAATKFYIPNSMQGAQNFFKKNYYDNSVSVTTTTLGTIKLGIKLTASSAKYWTCFDNFRLYCHGGELPTDIEQISACKGREEKTIYDLQGRRIIQPTQHGIYIIDGKKVVK